MKNITFKDLLEYVQGVSICVSDQKLKAIMLNANLLINEDEVVYTYPKHLFVKEKNDEVFVFTKTGKLLLFKTYSKNQNNEVYIKCEMFDLNNTLEICYMLPSYTNNNHKILQIAFSKDNKFTFNSQIDTNEEQRVKFDMLLTEIFRFLLNN